MAVINDNIEKTNLGKEPQVQLEASKFDALIESQGVRVTVYTTTLCPNIKKIDTLEHEIDCKLCHGTAFIDRNGVDTWAYLANQKLDRKMEKDGTWDDQVVAASFKCGISLQYFAKIELMDFTTSFYELVQRQQGNLDRLKYKAYQVNLLIDQHGEEYIVDRDFQIDVNGDIVWTNDQNQPTTGEIYSIHYEYPITFRAINALHVNRFSQKGRIHGEYITPVELPQQWLIKRDYLVTKEDLSGNPLAPNKIMVETTPPED